MLRSSLRLYQAAAHITKAEFLEAFSRVHPDALHHGKHKLALAVSGGVDSMALALMCREYLPRDRIELHGMIVDHGIRPSSSEEAAKTKEVLASRLDIKSHVLQLDLARTSSIQETNLRNLRYEALVRCCRSEEIKDVMTAHHLGDDYETALWRLAMGGRSFHIRPIARVPRSLEIFNGQHAHCIWKPPEFEHLDYFGVNGISDLTMMLRRPLLGFTKDRLVATCQTFKVPWTEDETNKDRQLTPRNALRHILAHHQLPEALSRSSLWEMIENVNGKTTAVHALATQLLSITHIDLDVRTGSAVVTMPTIEDIDRVRPVQETQSQLTSSSLPSVVGIYLNEIADFVHHVDGTHSASHQEDMDLLFGTSPDRRRFNIKSTLFDPLPNRQWLVFPAPLRISSKMYHQLPTLYLSYEYCPSLVNSACRSFNQRWWFRMTNPSTNTTLALRYLRPSHLSRLKSQLRSGHITFTDVRDTSKTPRNLFGILSELGPHHLRFCLPVIVEQSPDFRAELESMEPSARLRRCVFLDDETAETVLAFPTLNLRVDRGNRADAVPSWIQDLKWEMFYKHLQWKDILLDEMTILPKGSKSED